MTSERTSKPGIFIRLSNLIVFQVFFIFVALALILFYPNQQPAEQQGFDGIRSQMSKLSGRLAKQPITGDTEAAASADSREMPGLLGTQPHIRLLAICRVDPDQGQQPVKMETWIPGKSENGTDSADTDECFANLNHDMIRFVAQQESGTIISTMTDAGQSIHYCKIEFTGNESRILVAEVEHSQSNLPRSDLKYALFLLFLVSTLISLLTIYLISRRLKRPIDRLIHGLEKTAQGELFHLVESDGDEELSRLSQSFNCMTRTLWNNHKALKEYNVRLKKANYSLIESQIFLSTLIDRSPHSVIVASPDGKVMLCNMGASRDFGYDKDDLIGRDVMDLLSAAPVESVEQDTEYGSPGFEAICRRADGQTFPSFVVMSPILTDGSEPRAFLYLLTDITDSKNFQDMMVRLDRYCTRGEMAGDIAHEINNYLAILSGNVELMPIILRKGDQEKIDKKLALMKTTVDKIAHFANGLMDLPQDEAVFESGSLNQEVENVLAFLKPQNKFDNINVTACLCAEIPFMSFDQGQIQQLLVNLIYNAAEAVATREENREIRISTSLVAVEYTQFARIEVSDNGPGVPPDKVDVLFKGRFTTRRKGHGIGLVTCGKIAERHQATMMYRYDEGAVFYLDIPLETSRSSAEEAVDQGASTTSAPA